jgi:hypothetical protein
MRVVVHTIPYVNSNIKLDPVVIPSFSCMLVSSRRESLEPPSQQRISLSNVSVYSLKAHTTF